MTNPHHAPPTTSGHFTRYRDLLYPLAVKLLGPWVGDDAQPVASPSVRVGQGEASMAVLAPLALGLLTGNLPDRVMRDVFDALADAADQHGGSDVTRLPKLRDPWGGTRPAYYAFACHLLLQGRKHTDAADPDALARVMAPVHACLDHAGPAAGPGTRLWLASLVRAHGQATQDPAMQTDAADRIEACLRPDQVGPLLPLDAEDNLDFWTFEELVGIHAAARLALPDGPYPWQQRLHRIADFHLEHTQPDNATNQPWGVAAFLTNAERATFADQQMHDAFTHVSTYQHAASDGSLMAGLLLADAATLVRDLAEAGT